MTYQELVSWLTITSSVLQTVQMQYQQVDELLGQLVLTTEMQDKKRVATVESEISRNKAHAQRLEGVLYRTTDTTTIQEAMELVLDVQVRVKSAADLYEEWRTRLALLELADAVDAFNNPSEGTDISREDALALIVYSEQKYNAQLVLVTQLIPEERKVVVA